MGPPMGGAQTGPHNEAQRKRAPMRRRRRQQHPHPEIEIPGKDRTHQLAPGRFTARHGPGPNRSETCATSATIPGAAPSSAWRNCP